MRCCGAHYFELLCRAPSIDRRVGGRPCVLLGIDSMASSRGTGVRQTKESDGEAAKLRQLVQTLRGDLNLLSNEAKKKYPAVREVSQLSQWLHLPVKQLITATALMILML